MTKVRAVQSKFRHAPQLRPLASPTRRLLSPPLRPRVTVHAQSHLQTSFVLPHSVLHRLLSCFHPMCLSGMFRIDTIKVQSASEVMAVS